MRAFPSLAILVVPLAAAATLSACEHESTMQRAATQPPIVASHPSAPETVRACRTAVYGELASAARRNAVTLGPVSLLVADGDRRADFEPSGVVKVLVLIRAGERVTLVVPENERNGLSMLYGLGPGPKRPLRLSDGTSSVRFTACTSTEKWAEERPYPDPHETQFNGGFFVRGAHCALLDVWIDGRAGPSTLGLGFGMSDRPCPDENAGG